MKIKTFGSTALQVSEIGFGCARLGGFLQDTKKGDILTTLRLAFDNGITFYDTADMYCQGESEKLLGEAFHSNRDQVVIASKGGYCLPKQRRLAATIKPFLKAISRHLGIQRKHLPSGLTGTLSQDFTPAYLTKAIEGSLKRLNTDYLDLYQLHSPPRSVIKQGDFIDVLETMKQQGKIRYYGVSCETIEDALLCLDYPGISSLQIGIGLLDQEALEEGIPKATAQGVGIIGRGCFGGGLLKNVTDTQQLKDSTSKWQSILEFNSISEQNGRVILESALQFMLGVEAVAITLVGMRTARQLSENLRYASARPLSDAEYHSMRAIAAPMSRFV